ncbi:MAG: hypothetical protein AAGA30_04225 [Planctomycetota bacterium]
MFEIFIPFYMAISFLIGWSIFSPFSTKIVSHSWAFAQIQLADFLALFFPCGIYLSVANIWIGRDTFSLQMNAILIFSTMFMASAMLAAALFLLGQMSALDGSKRMVLVGIVVPMGLPLTVAWVILPIYAFTISIHLAVPALFAILMLSIVLRCLSVWICSGQNP